MIRCDSPLHHLTLIPSVSISTATTCTILSIIITITNPYLAFRQPLPRWIFGPYYSKKIGFLWYCFRISLLEKVLIFRDLYGATTDLLENVLIFRDSHRAPTNLLEKVLIFRDSLGAPTNLFENIFILLWLTCKIYSFFVADTKNLLILRESHVKTVIGLFYRIWPILFIPTFLHLKTWE